MISRWARPEEQTALQALWRRVFGDGPELTGAFWDRFPPEKHTRVIDRDGLAAMASWIPVTLCTACVRILSEEPVDMRATRVICSIRGLASHFAGASIIGAIVGHVTGECL